MSNPQVAHTADVESRRSSTKSTVQIRRSRGSSQSKRAPDRLLGAAIRVFGQHGLHGTSTRALAHEAGVNLQAIAYHFGHKEGLYRATAREVAESLAEATAHTRGMATQRLSEFESEGVSMSPAEARDLLRQIVEDMAMVFIDDETAPLTLFVIREQMAPTETFHVIREILLVPLFDVMSRLTGQVLGEPPDSERVRLRALSLLGAVMVFRVAHAGAMAQLGWGSIDEDRRNAVRRHVAALLEELGSKQS